jgi:hypothetical protein
MSTPFEYFPLDTSTTPGVLQDEIFAIAEQAINHVNSAASALTDPTSVIPAPESVEIPIFDTADSITFTPSAMPSAPTVTEPTVGDLAALDPLSMSIVVTDQLISDSITVLRKDIFTRMGYNPTTLAAGGAEFATGLNTSVEAGIFTRGRDRITIESSNLLAQKKAAISSKGWKRPTGAALTVVETSFVEKESQISLLNDSIIVKQAELEQSNLQNTLQQFIALENAWLSAKTSDESNKIRKFETENEVGLNYVKIANEINQIKVSLFSSSVQAYVAEANIKESEAKVLLGKVDSLNQATERLSSVTMQKAQMLNTYYLGKFNSEVEAKKAAASAYVGLASTALNAVNISTSFSYGTHFSGSESHSFSGV